ncbi:MAG: hypothetical protein KCHDKBKB_01203 [Elusimicrobia bacterium]|nr:hypothetical protein [Elusimicrobiota bacterium]
MNQKYSLGVLLIGVIFFPSLGRCENQPPVAASHAETTLINTPITIPLIATDPDGDPLTFSIVTGVSNGSLEQVLGDAVTYTPNLNFTGTDSFTFIANDGFADSNEATMLIMVQGGNNGPIANDVSANVDENTQTSILLMASDGDGDTLQYIVVDGPSHGTVDAPVGASINYTPTSGYVGPDSFTYKVNDGTEDSNLATVSLQVNGVNDAPVANNVSDITLEDTPKAVTMVGSDGDGDTLTYSIVSGPLHGTLSAVSGNQVTYTPGTNYNGSDSFTYKVNDGTVDSNVAAVSIQVNAANDAPVANNISETTSENTAIAVTMLGSDGDGDTLTYVIVSGPLHGTLDSVSGDQVTYTPAAGYNGSDSFTYKVNDGTVDSNVATVSIQVNAVNDAPVASNVSETTSEDTAKTVTMVGADGDGDALTYAIVSGPSHGTLGLVSGNSVTYTPASNYNGADSFTYKVNDGTVDSNVATVSIQVNAVNDAPMASNVSETTSEDTAKIVTLIASDSDGDTLTYSIVLTPSHGTLSAVSGNQVTYTPAAGYNGSDSFTYKVNDGTVDSNEATVSIQVNAVNDAPVASNVSETTSEDTAKTVTMVGTDGDGDALTYAIVSGPSHGTLGLVSGNSVTYTPAAGYNGSDSFTYKVNDGTVDSNVATVSLQVNPVNDAPVASNVSEITSEDTAKMVTLSASDSDGDTLTYSIVLTPSHGTLSAVSGNQVTYTPAAGYNGSDSFTYKVNDGTVDSNVATVSIQVNAVNDAPVASNVSETTSEDVAKIVTLSASDSDGDTLTYSIVLTPSHGTLSAVSGNQVTYTPAAGYNGSDSFTYKVNDGTVDSNEATVSIQVNAVNDAPVASNVSETTSEDTAKTVTMVGTDGDGDALTYAIVSGPSHGTLGLVSGNSVTYTPAAGYNGSDSFTYKVNDGTVDSNVATVSLQVNPVNDAPVASNVSEITSEDTAKMVTLSASDSDGDTLTYSIVLTPSHGTLSAVSGNQVTYTPAAGYNGSDSFTYKVNDGTVDSNVATVSIQVNAVNDAPVASNVSETTSEDTAKMVTLSASDGDGDTLTYSIVLTPSHGTLSAVSGNQVTYTPAAGYNGSDSFTYKVNDGSVDSNVATVSIQVNAVNDAPMASNVSETTSEDTAKIVTLSASDSDGDTLTYSIVLTPSHGTLSAVSGNQVTYTPAAGYNGSDSFTYKVNDGTVDSNVATVSLQVNAVNDAPTAANVSETTSEDTAKTVTMVGTDGDGDALTYVIVSGPSHGSLGLVSGNSVTYTPAAGYNGSDSFTYKVNDGTVDSNVATVSITVNPVNDAPVASNVSETTSEDTAKIVTLIASDSDGDTLTYSIVLTPSHGTLSAVSGNQVTYTPAAGYNGSDSFTYKVNDGTVDSNVATVSLQVNAVNDAPTAANVSETTSEDTAKTVTMVGTDGDGDALTYVIVSGPSHGSLGLVSGNSVTYTPAAGYNGSDSFTYKVNDGTVDSNVATVSITVNPVNDAPVASNVSETTSEDTAKIVTLIASDSDGDTLTYSIVLTPSHGTLSAVSGNQGTYTPAAGYNGSDSFTYKVNDGTVDSNVATVSLQVNAVNEAPVANNISGGTFLDTAYAVTMVASDGDGDPLTYSIVTGPSHGSLGSVTGNTVVYTPVTGYLGTDTFSYQANDGSVNSNIAMVSILVEDDNHAPTANEVNDSTTEDTQKTLTLSGSDVDGDTLTYSIVLTPSHGTLSAVAGNQVTYTPASNYNGADSFTYKVNDGTVDSNVATVSIAVNPANDAPMASNVSETTSEDTAKTVTMVGTDGDGDALTYAIVSDPSHGSLGLVSGNSVTYTPAAGYNGSDSFTYKVNDGTVDSNVATVSIQVNAVNDVPVASNVSETTSEDTAKTVTMVGTDGDGDALTYVIVSGPSHGSLGLVSGNSVTYTPAAGYNGADSFTYKVNDGIVDSNVANVTILIEGANPSPIANNSFERTTVDSSLVINPIVYDENGDPFSIDIVNGPSHGAAIVIGSQIRYTPQAGYIGSDGLTYKANDGFSDSNIAVISLQVTTESVPDQVSEYGNVPEVEVQTQQGAVVSGITQFELVLSRDLNNNDPMTSTKTFSTSCGMPLVMQLPERDIDNDLLTYTVMPGIGFKHGVLTITGAVATYVPSPGKCDVMDSAVLLIDDQRAGTGYLGLNITVGSPGVPFPVVQDRMIPITFPDEKIFSLNYAVNLTTVSPPLPYRGYRTVNNSIVTYSPSLTRADNDAMIYMANVGENYLSAVILLPISSPEITSAKWHDETENGPVVATMGTTLGIQTADIDTTVYPNGLHTFVAVVQDAAGLKASSAINVIIDNTPPTCAYSVSESPLENSWVKENISFVVTVVDDTNGSGVQGANLVDPRNSQPLPYIRISGTSDWTFQNFNTLLLADGHHIFNSECFDRANNVSGKVSRNLFVDNTAPTVTMALSPNAINGIIQSQVSVDVTATDAMGSGVVQLRLLLDGQLLATSFPYLLNTDSYSEGTHVLTAEAIDTLGNLGVTTQTLVFDRSEPIMEVASPVNGASVVGSLNQVQFTITESNGISPDSPKMYIDGAQVSFTKSGDIYTFLPAVTSNGLHFILIETQDTVGNVGTIESSFVLLGGNNIPLPDQAEFITPAANSFIGGGGFPVRAYITDNSGPVSGVVLNVNGGSPLVMTTSGDNVWTYDLNTTAFSQGSATLSLTFQDGTGATVQQSVNVTIDNTLPSITQLNLIEGDQVSGAVPIEMSVTDNFSVHEILIMLDGQVVAVSHPSGTVTSDNLTYLWDSTGVTEGTHEVAVIVRDKSGNSRSVTRHLVVENGTVLSPVITILTPQNNDAISAITPLRMVVDGPLLNAGFRIDGGALIPATQVAGTNEYKINLNSTLYADGNHNIEFVAMNAAGPTTLTTTVFIDNTPPVVNIDIPVNNQIIFLVKNFIARAFDSSNLPLTGVRMFINASPLAFFPGNVDPSNHIYSYTLDTSAAEYLDGDYNFVVIAQDKAGNETQVTVPFRIDNVNVPISNALVDWTPAASFVVGPENTVVSAKISNASVDGTSVTDAALKCTVTVDGQTRQLPGSVRLVGNTLRFWGSIPSNAMVHCTLNVLDMDGKAIRQTHHFISGMDHTLGGTVTLLPEGLLKFSIPPYALKTDAFVEMVKLPAEQFELDGREIVYGPIQIRAADSQGHPTVLVAPGRMRFERSIQAIPEPQRNNFIDQAEVYSQDQYWKILGGSGITTLTKSDTPGARTISVPIEQFGIFRITALALPAKGVSNLFNMPNPFSPAEGGTDISYLLGADSDVDLVLYDLFGNLVRRMEISIGNEGAKIGQNTVHWDGKNGAGKVVANGGYILQITAKDSSGSVTRARYKVGVAK